jgi:hypothetical protein
MVVEIMILLTPYQMLQAVATWLPAKVNQEMVM